MHGGLLILSHSARPFDAERASLNFLSGRYSDPGRLVRLPPLDTLRPDREYLGWQGALSLHRLVWQDDRLQTQMLATLRTAQKIQHGLLLDSCRLLLCFEDHLEVWRFPVEVGHLRGRDIQRRGLLERRFDHPWFAGVHNAAVMAPGRVAVSASAPDAVLILELQSGDVSRILRMPEGLYGRNYDLDVGRHDLHSHYIANDQQLTHLNWVAPAGRERLLVSGLIPGSVGFFDLRDGRYTEVLRGMVGCHGARLASTGEIYFADSTNGNLVFVGWDGVIRRRCSVESRWLHDVQEISPGRFALAVADHNAYQIIDIDADTRLAGHRFRTCTREAWQPFCGRWLKWLGNSTQFFSFHLDGMPREGEA